MKPVAFITGASSGIGAASAYEFARRGYRVALVARRTDRLKVLKEKIEGAGGEALALTGDVTDVKSLEAAVAETVSKYGRMDVVLANAGFGVSGPFEKLKPEDFRRQFETNVFGVLNTLYATKAEVIRQKGILAIVGSVAGQVPLPMSTPYSMSKFAVRALALGLRSELAPLGVSVVLISPGFIETEIQLVDNEGRLRDKPTKEFPKALVVAANKAAVSIVRAVLSRRKEVIITGHGKAFVFLNRYFPWIVSWASSRIAK